MQPEIHIGPLTLQSFGLMMGLGFVVGRDHRDQAPEGDRQAHRLGLRDGLRRADRRHRRRAPVVGDRRTGTRRRTTSSARSSPAPAWSSTAALLGGALAVIGWALWRKQLGLQLFDLAAAPLAAATPIGRHRLPARRRRRLRHAVEPAVGDGVSRTAPCRPPSRSTRRRSTSSIAMSLVAWWLWRQRDRWRAGRAVRALPGAGAGSSASWSSSSAATTTSWGRSRSPSSSRWAASRPAPSCSPCCTGAAACPRRRAPDMLRA